jgi:acetyl esterase/lipase
LRANAGRFGYDAARIAVVGESAGGQPAVLLDIESVSPG